MTRRRLDAIAENATLQAVALGLQAAGYAVAVLWAADWLLR